MKLPLVSVFSYATRRAIRFDLLRLRARIGYWWGGKRQSDKTKLHLGCGLRRVPGWLNVDLTNSDLNVDIASEFPWRTGQFDAVVSQHVIEHFEIHRELLPLLKEVRRVCRPGAEVWLSTPDMARVCAEYQSNLGKELITDRQRRFPEWDFCQDGLPTSHVINHFFQQDGEHKNLFDFELLSWVLQKCGFEDIERVTEAELLARFPEFPLRDDDWQSLYVRAIA